MCVPGVQEIPIFHPVVLELSRLVHVSPQALTSYNINFFTCYLPKKYYMCRCNHPGKILVVVLFLNTLCSRLDFQHLVMLTTTLSKDRVTENLCYRAYKSSAQIARLTP